MEVSRINSHELKAVKDHAYKTGKYLTRITLDIERVFDIPKPGQKPKSSACLILVVSEKIYELL